MTPTPNLKSKLRKKKSEKQQNPKLSDTLSSEDLFDHSISQEEQAERYQFGPKSKSHYIQSITTYQKVIQLESTLHTPNLKRLFDSFFNCGKLLVHFGLTFCETHDECLRSLVEGVGFGREAVRVMESFGDRSELVDAWFNLGSSLNSLGELLSTSIGSDGGDEEKSELVWDEARGLFMKAFELQSLMFMEQSKGIQSGSDIDDHSGEEEEVLDVDDEDGNQVSVKESFVVTPSVMIDTLVSLIDVLLSLLPNRLDQIIPELNQYGSELLRIGQLSKSSPIPIDQDLEVSNCLISVELSVIESSLSNSNLVGLNGFEDRLKVIMEQLNKLEDSFNEKQNLLPSFLEFINFTNNHSTLCTTYSLVLFALNSLTSSNLELLQTLCEKTQSFHELILKHLQGYRIKPIPKLLSYQIPSMISSSLLGQSETHLLLYYLSNQTNEKLLKDSFGLVIEAFNQTKPSIQLVIHSFEPETIKLQVIKPTINDTRNDWSCRTTRSETIKQIIRLKFLYITRGKEGIREEEVVGIVEREIGTLVKRFGVGKDELRRFSDECLGDFGGVMSEGKEQVMWRCLLRM